MEITSSTVSPPEKKCVEVKSALPEGWRRAPLPIEKAVADLLACPKCKKPLRQEGLALKCTACNFAGEFKDEVVAVEPLDTKSFFDDQFKKMLTVYENAEKDGSYGLCYKNQIDLLKHYIKPGDVVLDVGCGGGLPYRLPEDCTLIGLDYSFPSVRSNRDVNLRIFGSATSIPLRDQSVDVMVCLYSIHHIIGRKRHETHQLVNSAFQEFSRVIKKGGMLFVFEMTPWKPFAIMQDCFWNTGKVVLGSKLDMYFWSCGSMDELGQKHLKQGLLERIHFQNSMLTTFAPIFAIPYFKVYRFMYPLTPRLYKWVF